MKAIYVLSTMFHSGKNLVALGLLHRLQAEGKKVGCFLPLGVSPIDGGGRTSEADARFFRDTFKLSDPEELLCPVIMTTDLVAAALAGERLPPFQDKILEAWGEIRKGKDVMVVVGAGNVATGEILGLCQHDLVRLLGAYPLVVTRSEPLEYAEVERVLLSREVLGRQPMGAVFNRVHPSRVQARQEQFRPFLERQGVELLGVIPDDPVVGAVTVRQIAAALRAQVLCGQDHLDNLVERFQVGAMSLEMAMRYFRQSANKAVVTGGDRGDIQLAALETSTRCLVLSGGLIPYNLIIARAEEVGVPILLVQDDTFAVVETLQQMFGHLGLGSESKLEQVFQLAAKHLDFPRLRKILGG